jgi:class 3 adenylate cyclase/tetratricopeptide (TPR) repeat protein
VTTCSRCGERVPGGSRFCPSCGAPLAEALAGGDRRKVVTVVFADVVGSTALGERVDPETLRWAMQRWFGRMAEAIQRHGGTVENYIGDAVMAVFGVPVAHEDDALRAVRAAAEMSAAVAELRGELREQRSLDFDVRIGVNTGEAVTGVASGGGYFTAGDIVNVAARLEQSAPPGEVLLGRDTLRLVAHAVQAEPVAPLTVKGKGEAVEAFRLLSVAHDAPVRPQRPRPPMVDRERERALVSEAIEATLADGSCRVLTVLGAAGVGKSRLVADVVDRLHAQATVTAGRCLPYGDGLTWWPLVEALGGGLLDQVGGEGGAAVARAGELLRPGGDPVAPDEAFWAVSRVLESLARRRPLVLVLDDLQWADPLFMDLLEHVAARARDVPLFLLVMARPELLDHRPRWAADLAHADSVLLEPLADDDAATLLDQLAGPASLGPRAATHILDVAEGNPLFVVEVVSMLEDDRALAGGEVPDVDAIAIPPTIQALLAARLDRLTPSERAVIEAASIEGKEFGRERVEALVAGTVATSAADDLFGLVRKDLIEPFGPGTFRFCHQLIRDAAYEGMPKDLRARLHERFAAWLEARPLAFPIVDELVGYHLERALALRRELGEGRAGTAALAARASASLAIAGRRAAQRDDQAAAGALLQRAVDLVDEDDAARGALLPALGAALFEAGRMGEATAVLDEAIARAPEPALGARARIEREFVRLEIDTSVGAQHAGRVADEVLPVVEAAADDHGQCRAWSLRAQADWVLGQVGRADLAWERATDCARRSGDELELFAILGWRATAAVLGPAAAGEGIERCERMRELVAPSPVATAWVVNALGPLHAMRGEPELADRLVREANETIRQLGSLHASVSHMEAIVRMLCDEPAEAERVLRAGVETLTAMSEGGLLATTAAMLAQALYAQGRLDEAQQWCVVAEGAGATDDIATQVIWRGVEAKVRAHEGRSEAAETLAREGVRLVQPTDLLSLKGDAMLDLAEVLRLSSREYQEPALGALTVYEQKGNVVGSARVRALLEN